MDGERSSVNRREKLPVKDALPPIGSFDLISDLVRDYTTLTIGQNKEKSKLDLDSLRAFPGTKVSKNSKLSKDKDAWEERRSRSMAAWGTECSTNIKTTLFRKKGLREVTGTTGRFNTSTKPWLEGYDTVREKFQKGLTPKIPQMSTTFGQAMFNFKRTMPNTGVKEDANRFIRQKNNPLAPLKTSGTNVSMTKNLFSPKRYSDFYASR